MGYIDTQINNLKSATIGGDGVNNQNANIKTQNNYFKIIVFMINIFICKNSDRQFKKNKIYNINLKKYDTKEIEIFDHISFNRKYNKHVLTQILLFALLTFSVMLEGGVSPISFLFFIIFCTNFYYLNKEFYAHVYKKEIDIKDNNKIKFVNPKLNLMYPFDFRPKYKVYLYNSDNKYKTIYFEDRYYFDLFKADMEKL